MNITFNPLLSQIKNITNTTFQTNPVNFKGLAPLENDSFEKSRIKNVKVQDMGGNICDVEIKRDEIPDGIIMCSRNSDPVKFEMNIPPYRGVRYHATAYGKKDKGFYLEHLYTDEVYSRKYKGAGTELLRCVVEESKKRGCKGQVNVTASNFPPPFVFYYKNNFRVIANCAYFNAAIDYAARKNIPVTKIIEKSSSCLPMELSPEAADAFLEGKRQYEDRYFETFDEREVEGNNLEANLIEAPKGAEEDYYLLIINSSKEEHKQRYVTCLSKKVDENGKKTLEVHDTNDIYASYKELDYAEEMLVKAAEKLGYEETEIVQVPKFSRRRSRKSS